MARQLLQGFFHAESGTSWVVMTVSADLKAGCVIMLSIFIKTNGYFDRLLTYCRKIMLSNILFTLNFSIDFFVK